MDEQILRVNEEELDRDKTILHDSYSFSFGSEPGIIVIPTVEFNGFLEGFWILSEKLVQVRITYRDKTVFEDNDYTGESFVPVRVQTMTGKGKEYFTTGNSKWPLDGVLLIRIKSQRNNGGMVEVVMSNA